MKRLVALFLLLALLLSGCTGQSPQETETQPFTTAPTRPSEPETPVVPEDPAPDYGIYVEGSRIESDTDGAVREYAVPEDCYAACAMGDGLLLFSGSEDTALTLLREDTEPVTVTVEGQTLYPDGVTARVGPKGLSYHALAEAAVVFLDLELEEADRIELTDEISGTAVVTEDWSRVYYFDTDSLNYIETKTGIARDLKECGYPDQQICGIHFDDTLLECFTFTETDQETLFIDAQTGALVASQATIPMITTEGQWYFASHYDGFQNQLLCGLRDGQTLQLYPETNEDNYQALPQSRSVVLSNDTGDGCQLALYELTGGTRTAQVELAGLMVPWSIFQGTDERYIWFLTDTLQWDGLALYCWDTACSPTGDPACYLLDYYTALEPDLEGLARIEQEAEALGEKHGVQILVYEDAAGHMPDDFSFAAAYQVPLYEHYLEVLDGLLGCYPEGFLQRLGKMSDSRKLTISLVAGAYGDNALGAVSEADGVHFILDGDHYLTMVMNERFEATFFHEMFHAIDIYVFNNVSTYDDWDDLNPKGFEYDNDYIANQYREDYQYLQDEDRYFIDMYSMSYAKEDRARIMEYAMQEGMESYFQSPNMQAKLELLCKGIRKAFKLKDYEGELLWEQYLAE